MRRFAPIFALAASFCASAFAQPALPSLSDATIAPSGREIAFVSAGDIWTVPAGGGEAHLLVSHPATESRPLYSPDGTRLAFVSTRTGAGNIYILTLATGDLKRLTFSESPDRLDAWSADSQWIYFTSSVNDVAGQGDIFRVRTTGGTPLEVSAQRYMNEFQSAPSPDGTEIAIVAKGISNSQWWRNGHAHIDETELWLKPIAATGGQPAPYKKVFPADCKHAFPMWSPDGRTLYFMSDATGSENLWSAPIANPAAAKELTHFKQGRVLWPSLGAAGKTIVFERDFSIWSLDLASGRAAKVSIELRGASPSPAVTRTTETAFRTLAVAPDGKKLIVTAHGQLFAASARDGGEALRLKSPAIAATDAAWSPDSMSVVYTAERIDGARQLELYDFKTSLARPLTTVPGEASNAIFSPDGKLLAYLQNDRELHVLNLPATKDAKPVDRMLAKGELRSYGQSALAWSPDSQWIAFPSIDARSFRNLSVVPAAGGEPRPITFLANGETGRVAWSPDGKFILFATGQRSERQQIARVDLLPHVPRFREDEFADLFRPTRQPGTPNVPGRPNSPDSPLNPDAPTTPDTTKTADTLAAADARPDAKPDPSPRKKPEPVKIVFEGIRNRLTLLPLDLGAEGPVISPDGKVLLFVAESANQQQLYTYSLDELAREPAVPRQLTSTPGRKSSYTFGPDSKEVFFLENEGIRTIALESRTPKPIAVSARVAVDFDAEKKVVFEEAWSILNQRFFDPTFTGHDWRKIHDEWQPYAAGARTPDELRRDINLMIGELDTSHSGIGAPRPAERGPNAERPTQVGNLGLRFDRDRYEHGDGLIVREVVTLGPAFIEGSIKPGDKLISVNGDPIGQRNLDDLLTDTVNRRVVLGIETAGKPREAIVRPIANTAATGLLYRQWVEERRALVDRVSGGKVGYVHLAAMGDPDLAQLYLDLDAANESKQAVIVDVRNNNGGYINGYALDVFTRKNYLEMTPRDMGTIPSRQALGQRALGLPTVLITNESTLSDGEDFTEGYRTLKLGEVVGEPTAGWIIFTGGTNLIDGSTLRLPGSRVRTLTGQDMERHPRPVDVEVDRSLGETDAHTDAQLERAVQELLKK